MKSSLLVFLGLVLALPESGVAAGVWFHCRDAANQWPVPFSLSFSVPDAGEGAKVEVNGDFSVGVASTATQPVSDLASWARQSGLPGRLVRIETRMDTAACRWKSQTDAKAPNVIVCNQYDALVTLVDDHGAKVTARAKFASVEAMRITRERAQGTSTQYETSVEVQGMDDQLHRSIQQFRSRGEGCQFEA